MNKGIQKIFTEFYRLNSFTKTVIKRGTQLCLLLLTLGTVMIFLNRVHFSYDSYYEFIATSVIKNSFIILAEVIVGGLLIDYVFNKK
ncbi:MAG: hypothetical protein N3I35_09005 [Clostridia bacterium]|nr:hypothetical protein [Clostridia bacterium]